MSKLIFINRFFHPDSSATSIILSELLSNINSSFKNFDAVVLTGQQMHVTITDYNVCGLENIKVVRFWQISNLQRSLIISFINFVLFYLLTFIWLVFFANRKSTVVAKSDPPMLSVPVALASLLKRFRLICWQQDIFPETSFSGNVINSKFIFAVVAFVRDISLKRAERIVVPSNDMAHYFSSRGVPTEKINVIENFASGNIFHQQKNLFSYNIQDKFIIGYAGNLGIAHDVDLFYDLILSFRYNNNITFQIYGSGSGLKVLEKRCIFEGLANVTFNGYCAASEVNNVLNSFDFHIVSLKTDFSKFVYPSKFYNAVKLKSPTIFIGPKSSSMADFINARGIGFNLSEVAQLQQCIDYVELFCNSAHFRAAVLQNCEASSLAIKSIQDISQDWSKILYI